MLTKRGHPPWQSSNLSQLDRRILLRPPTTPLKRLNFRQARINPLDRRKQLHINPEPNRAVHRGCQHHIRHRDLVPHRVLPGIQHGELLIRPQARGHKVLLPLRAIRPEALYARQDPQVRHWLDVARDDVDQLPDTGACGGVRGRRE